MAFLKKKVFLSFSAPGSRKTNHTISGANNSYKAQLSQILDLRNSADKTRKESRPRLRII